MYDTVGSEVWLPVEWSWYADLGLDELANKNPKNSALLLGVYLGCLRSEWVTEKYFYGKLEKTRTTRVYLISPLFVAW